MGVRQELVRLLDAIDDVPDFPFGADVKAACDAVENNIISEQDAAKHLRVLVDGARSFPKFPFGDDLDRAERALRVAGY